MELLDVVDENGIPTGETVERSIAHAKGIRHRTSHVWLLRCFQQKAKTSYKYDIISSLTWLQIQMIIRGEELDHLYIAGKVVETKAKW